VFDWLFEGRTSIYVILAALSVFLLLVWWQTRKRGWLIGVAVAVGLVGLYALLDRMVETDREQIVRKVNEMAAAVNSRNLDALFANISDDFRSPRGRSKEELRNDIKGYLEGGIVKKATVWDIVCEGTPSRDNPPVRVFFKAKAEGAQEFLADCDCTFDFDPGHGWRLKSIRLLKPQMTEEWQIQL
jgi:hypothetical protein